MPKVSVVVPVFNGQAYLDECLSSLEGQSLSDIEAIIVNDGSTDGTKEIAESWVRQDSRFRLIDKPNTGYGNSMNRGFESATGEFVTVLESDDYFPPNACEIMLRSMEGESLDFLKADGEIFFGEGSSRTFSPAPVSVRPDGYGSVFDSAADPGRFPCRAGLPAMYRASFLREHGIRFHETPGASFQDTGFWAQCMFCGRRVHFIHDICYEIRRDNPSSSELDRGKVYVICDEYDFVRKRIESLPGINYQAAVRACAYYRFGGYLWNCSRIGDSNRLEFLERFSQEFRDLDSAGELDRTYFSPEELPVLERIMDNPEAFFCKEYYNAAKLRDLHDTVDRLSSENEALRKELAAVVGSRSFQLGRALTTPGRKVRDSLKGKDK